MHFSAEDNGGDDLSNDERKHLTTNDDRLVSRDGQRKGGGRMEYSMHQGPIGFVHLFPSSTTHFPSLPEREEKKSVQIDLDEEFCRSIPKISPLDEWRMSPREKDEKCHFEQIEVDHQRANSSRSDRIGNGRLKQFFTLRQTFQTTNHSRQENLFSSLSSRLFQPIRQMFGMTKRSMKTIK